MTFNIVILAAGQGKRMHSKQPKVLHHLAGKPLLEHVINQAMLLKPTEPPIVVYGHQGQQVRQALGYMPVAWVEQKEQLGTGHALLQAMPLVAEGGRILVLYGDVPLISESTLRSLMATPEDSLSFVTVDLPNPTGYGRVKRDAQGHILGIIEEKDATDPERAIPEVNSGIYWVSVRNIKKWLPKLSQQNVQKEYYLTDIIPAALSDHVAIHTVQPQNIEEVLGVNDRVQLATLERFYQRTHAEKLMRAGITIMDPTRIDIRGELHAGKDVTIDVNVIIEGKVTLGDGCTIGPHCILRNTQLGDHVEVHAYSLIDGAEISSECVVGPFARIRPGSFLESKVHIGNFVEIKNSEIGTSSKVNHLSYIGDCDIGKRVNVGAGTITCNYDGVNKHRTVIHDDVFVGSATQFVAPVTIGKGATIGAGSTITEDAPAQQLTLARAKQCTIDHWQRPQKKEKK